MKYQAEVKEMIKELCSGSFEDWMDDSDKKEMVSIMTENYSQVLSDSIQEGVDLGFPLEFQMKKAREMFRAMFTGGEFVN